MHRLSSLEVFFFFFSGEAFSYKIRKIKRAGVLEEWGCRLSKQTQDVTRHSYLVQELDKPCCASIVQPPVKGNRKTGFGDLGF